jgi:two-component system chemotaxis sensor kinase CheA
MSRAIELAFSPGVTTAERTTDVSGRGVGLDAVLSLAKGLGGSVDVSSEPGRGTTVQVTLPRTGATVHGLVVEARRLPFVLPVEHVERFVRIGEHTVRDLFGKRALVLGEGALPLVDLGEEVGLGPDPDSVEAVLVHVSAGRIAVRVGAILGERRLVSRPVLGGMAFRLPVTGGVVLPSGATALVVDCDALAARIHTHSDRASNAA